MTVIDSGFVNVAVVQAAGNARIPTLVTSTQLTVTIPASDVATAGFRTVRVVNPAPCAASGCISNQGSLEVDQPTLVVNTTAAAPGAVVMVSLSFGTGNAGDFLAVASTTAANTTFLRWMPVGAGATTRSWSFPLPRTAGTYEVRLFANNGGTRLATSSSIVATGLPCTDTDGDDICDSYETNTGVYLSPTNTGTNPNLADTDGDSLRDGDEVFGTVNGLNLPGMGTKPLR